MKFSIIQNIGFKFSVLIYFLVVLPFVSFSKDEDENVFKVTWFDARDSIIIHDTLNDSIPKIVYSYNGVAKSVVDYLEGQNSPLELGSYLSNKLGVEIDPNQALLLNMVASYYGLTDIVGDSNNAQVLQFFTETDHPEITDDDMSWCSVYMSWCAKNVNLERSTSLLARSWLEVGQIIDTPQPGDLVIFWREKQKSWQGHVSIFLSEDPETHQIFCIGGNQDDKVCVKPYPAEQVLGYRRLTVEQQ